VGWFNESYFPAYCEDSDYHVRMHRADVRAVCVDLPFLHHGAGTIKHAGTGEVARIRRGADRNRERFRQEYGCLPGSEAYQELFIGADTVPVQGGRD
jgi:GT2 family glycosyltransferase